MKWGVYVVILINNEEEIENLSPPKVLIRGDHHLLSYPIVE
jgi:hypothetical protein